MQPASSELVQLSVGGSPFLTTRTTLCAQPGTLASMFSGETEPTLLRDAEGRYFIDRDGKHFSRVLNYLRDGALVLPASDQECQELRTEAEFYNLTGLAGLVDARMEAAERRRQQAERAAAEPTAAEDAAVRQIAAKLATPSPIYDLEDCNQRLTTVRRQIASLYRAIGAISLPPETRLQMLLQMHPIEFKLAELELSSRRMLR